MQYSIVIPVYNSGKWIKELVKEIIKVMDRENEAYEIILVNDCSPMRNTWICLKEVCMEFHNVTIIDLQYNAGQQNALLCGFKHSKGKYVITMDDDFQHDPTDLPKFIHRIKKTNCDCIIGKFIEKRHNIIRRMGSIFANKLSEKIYNKPPNVASNSYRILSRKLVDTLLCYTNKKPRIGPMIFSVTQNIDTVEILHHDRAYGKSGYSISKLISETFNIVVNASTFPLDFVSRGGVLVASISFCIGLIYFILYLVGRTSVPGFTAQILVTTFFSGVILLSIGIVGKYIGRIVQEMIGFPPFMESEVLTSETIEMEAR